MARDLVAKPPSAVSRIVAGIWAAVRPTKAAVNPTVVPAAAVGSSFWGIIRESFAGAWQRNVELLSNNEILRSSAVYACITLISDDVSKLRPMLMQAGADGIPVEVTNHPAFGQVIRKPNDYQTWIQFLSQWLVSKLIWGNVYVLKVRDNRNVVIQLHVLNPQLVKTLVAPNGDVFYDLSGDKLAGLEGKSITVPATEIIHDRCACFFHPLIGVPPIFAAALSATQGSRIQNNGAKFFENMSRPSGVLSGPDTIPEETANRIKRDFEANFSGANLGRLLVAGDGLEYTPMTIPAQQSQLIEQLEWTVADIARCFHVPLYKIAADGGIKFTNMAALSEDYYATCLQTHIECIEACLVDGLGLLGTSFSVELDLEGLLRMDPVEKAKVISESVKGGWMAPNEGRRMWSLRPVQGGENPFMQQQQFPLEVLVNQPAPGSQPQTPASADDAAKMLEVFVCSLETAATVLRTWVERAICASEKHDM